MNIRTADNLKVRIALRSQTTELLVVTCHMRSHSVTCHPTQVNAPRISYIRLTYQDLVVFNCFIFLYGLILCFFIFSIFWFVVGHV